MVRLRQKEGCGYDRKRGEGTAERGVRVSVGRARMLLYGRKRGGGSILINLTSFMQSNKVYFPAAIL